jgi:imidazolonepropionase-like amidohydrolase
MHLTTSLRNFIFVLLILNFRVKAQTIAIKAGHVIDVRSGTVFSNQVILIQNGRISQMGAGLNAKNADQVIDLTDSWVLPGLIDCHVHLTMNADYRHVAILQDYVEESTAFRALRGAYNAELLLYNGFTTVKEIGNDANYATADVAKAIRKGWVNGPSVFYAGKIIAPFGGQLSNINPEHKNFWEFEYLDADTPDELKKAIRTNIFYGANVIKLVSGDQHYFYSQEDIQAAVNEAHKVGIKLTCHVMGGEAARNVILGGADAIEHGFGLDNDLLKLMKEKGTFLVGTDFSFGNLYSYGKDSAEAKQEYEQIMDRLKRAYQIGTKMAFGTDVIVDIEGMNRVQSNLEILKTWKAAGIPNAYTLKCMTILAAELLGVEKNRGLIAVGYRPDIIALKNNPLEDIENIRSVHFVMKNGRVIRKD